MDYDKVAVLMGGSSAERDISLHSGHAVLSALTRQGIVARGLDASVPFLAHLDAEGYGCAFIALHGLAGEDGTVQGSLEVMGVPYTGSGVLASALAMDKTLSKSVWRDHGLPTADWMEIKQADDLQTAARRLGFPLAIKPVRQGSSYGVKRVTRKADLQVAWQQARRYDERVMAEQWVDGMELTASILEGVQLPLVGLSTPRSFYDYEAKYESAQTRYLCPCGLPRKREAALRELAAQAFAVLGACGWGRVDLMLSKAGAPMLLELNTVPGLTKHSLVPMAARHVGIDFDDLALRLLKTSRHHPGKPGGPAT